MTEDRWTSRAITPSEAAILHHPDRRTAWAPAIVIEVAGAPLDRAGLDRALEELATQHSIVAARLRHGEWVAGGSPAAVASDEPSGLAGLCRPFDLTREPPVRVSLSADGQTVAVAAHHAALDGRALLAVAERLLRGAGSVAGGTPPASPPNPPNAVPGPDRAPSPATPSAEGASAGSGAARALQRLVRPADRVAPSTSAPSAEVFVSAELPPQAQARVAALAAAASGAAQVWNAARGAPWRRVGLTIPVGGPPVLGNVSTHRRVDVAADADIAAAVRTALDAPYTAGEGAPHPAVMRLLAPVVERFSDSLLVSNLGLVSLPGAAAVDFYPQARGRSAVALGAASVEGGARRLTLRARDLTQTDAQALLDATVARLSPPPAR